MAPKTAVAPATKNALSTDVTAMLALDAGRGLEGVTADDMVVPFMQIAQALSPQVNKREAAYIDGLEQGDFFNTATGQVWPGDVGFTFVPALYERKYLEFTPRDAGGGFHGERTAEALSMTQRDDKGRDILANGNELITCGTWYGLVVDPTTGEATQAVISMSKTQMRHSRRLMTQLRSLVLRAPTGQSFNPPLFYSTVHFTSLPEKNDQGSWFGFGFKLAGSSLDLPRGADLYAEAKLLAEAVASGAKRSASVEKAVPDDDIPF